MNNFNYGEILTRAWKHIWKHKVLWIFGILASCARRSGGGGNGGGGGGNYQTGSGGEAPFPTTQFERVMGQVGDYLTENSWVIIAFIAAILLLSILSYALGLMGRIGMIKGTFKAEKGAESMSFGEIWSESMPYFWRVFGLNFLIGLAFFIVVIIPVILIIVAIVMGGEDSTGMAALLGIGCLIPIICVLVPVAWVVSAVIEQAQAAMVLEDLGVFEGLNRGWLIVKANAVPMIVMFLILGIGGGIVGIIVSLPIIMAFVPILVGLGTLRQSLTPIYISLACCVAYMPVLIFLNGILTAYIQSAWTLTFMKVASPREDTPIIIEANA